MTKFKIGDMVKVIQYGHGCHTSEVGRIVKVVELGGYEAYDDEDGVRVEPPIGNSKSGGFNGFIGVTSFKLAYTTWKERYKGKK